MTCLHLFLQALEGVRFDVHLELKSFQKRIRHSRLSRSNSFCDSISYREESCGC